MINFKDNCFKNRDRELEKKNNLKRNESAKSKRSQYKGTKAKKHSEK